MPAAPGPSTDGTTPVKSPGLPQSNHLDAAGKDRSSGLKGAGDAQEHYSHGFQLSPAVRRGVAGKA